MNQFMINCPITGKNQALISPFLQEWSHQDQATEEGQPAFLEMLQPMPGKETAEDDTSR